MSDKPPEGGRDAFTREHLQKIARLIDEELPDQWGFALFAFPIGGRPGRLNYVGNGCREDIVNVIRQWVEKNGAIREKRLKK